MAMDSVAIGAILAVVASADVVGLGQSIHH